MAINAEGRPKSKVQIAVGKVAQASRGDAVPGTLAAAQEELVAAKLERSIDEALGGKHGYPPLTWNDAYRLAEYLKTAARKAHQR
jgi:hypothetical protein